jgi:amino acid transporter
LQKKVFVREATGLVRELSWWDGLFVSLNNIVLGPMIVTIISLGLLLFPASDLVAGTLLTLLGSFSIVMVWALLNAAMPRSGGEYTFNSRIIHPALGFAENWSFQVNAFVWAGYYAWMFSYLSLSQFFAIIGGTTGNQILIDWAQTVTEPAVTILIGAICIIAMYLVHVTGAKRWFRLNNLLIGFGVIGIIVAIALTISSSNASFISAFNTFSLKYTQDPDYYHTIINTASNGGLQLPVGYDLSQTAALMPVVFYGLGYAATANIYMAGELKRVKTSQLLGAGGGFLLSGLFAIVAIMSAENVMGREFLASIAQVQYSPDFKLPISPVWNLFVGLMTSNVVVNIIVQASFLVWSLAGIGLMIYTSSRCFLAWAFDRVVPASLADVSDRWHTPAKSLTIIVLASLGCLVWYTWVVTVYHDIFAIYTYFNAILVAVATVFTISAASAIVFPFRKSIRRFYEISGITYRIGRVPAIAVFGVWNMIFVLALIYYFITVPGLGATSGVQLPIYFFVSGLVVYYVAWAYWRRRGIDLSLAFKEIPPE